MAISRVERMKLLVDMAQNEHDQSLTRYQIIQQQRQFEAEQLEALNQYRDEYVRSMSNGDKSFFPSQLQSIQAFLEKLNRAVSAQKKQVEEMQASEKLAQNDWQSRRARVKALEKLVEKMQKNELARLDRVEQKLLDELSGQSAYQASLNQGD